MPIYEFECGACQHHFERLQKMSDPDPSNCPQCNDEAVQRKISAASFRLAGSGWYETDFKGEGQVKRNLVRDDAAPAQPAKPAEAAAES